jgi:Rrf2 family protein
MLAMLAEDPECLLSVRTAAEEVNVPYSFARSIQHGLVQAGIVESLRGVHGGMRLKVSPDDVTIRQVVEAVQGPMVMNDCTAPDGDCARMGACCYHPLWAGAQALMRDYLDSVSLGDIVAHRQFPAVDPKFADRAGACPGRAFRCFGRLAGDGLQPTRSGAPQGRSARCRGLGRGVSA